MIVPPRISTDTGGQPRRDVWSATTWPTGWDVRHVEETGSTNADLLEAALRGDVASRTALATDHQTAGRGRLDRRWDAPSGANLLVSLYVDSPRPPGRIMQHVALAALAAVEAHVTSATDGGESGVPPPAVDGLGLKWPNDVVSGDRKIAGVLAQAASRDDRRVIVVGCCLNVRWCPNGATRMVELAGCDVAPAAVLASMLEAYDELDRGGDAAISQRYRSRLVTLGRRVRVELPGDRHVAGSATDIDPDGRLEVTADDGVVCRFDVGDVVHLRPDRGAGAGDL